MGKMNVSSRWSLRHHAPARAFVGLAIQLRVILCIQLCTTITHGVMHAFLGQNKAYGKPIRAFRALQ